jgi:RNA polymerase sigma factor (sigma-70 family)
MDNMFKETYPKAIKSLERYARKIAKQNELLFEELMGEADVGIAELLSAYSPLKGTLKTYMVNAGKWQMLRWLKREVELGLHPVFLEDGDDIEEIADVENDQDIETINNIDVKVLLKDIDKLRPREVDVIKLYYLEEKTFKEVGQVLNISTERAKQIRQMALIRLKSIIRKRLIHKP